MSKLFKNSISKYSELHNEISETPRRRISVKNDSHNNLELDKPVVQRNDPSFSGAALNLILDNIASPCDVTNILEMEADRDNYINQVKECEFCKKKCNISKICCPKKEHQMHLLNNALEKLKDMSSQKIPFSVLKLQRSKKFFNIKKEAIDHSDESLDMLGRIETIRKIRRRMRNMKKYYPKVYYCQNSIIEEWGKDSFNFVNPEILELDPKANSIFWV